MATNRFTTLQRIIGGMMKENTGSSLCDSGRAYGYAYQRRAGQDLAAEPSFEIDAKFCDEEGTLDELSVTFSMFHYLTSLDMEYAPDMQRVYSRWYNSEAGEWGIEPFVEYLQSKGWTVKGYCGEDVYPVNTYNGESALDGVFLYAYLEAESPSGLTNFGGIMLSTHNGCDVRGGYSGFKFFSSWDYPVNDVAHVVLRCSGPEIAPEEPTQGILPLEGLPERDMRCHAWESYDAGYRFRPADGWDDCAPHNTDITAATAPVETLGDYGRGELRCPVCGGKMEAYWY
jgi:hypothetical protein